MRVVVDVFGCHSPRLLIYFAFPKRAKQSSTQCEVETRMKKKKTSFRENQELALSVQKISEINLVF
jgi:hypothetical protein